MAEQPFLHPVSKSSSLAAKPAGFKAKCRVPMDAYLKHLGGDDALAYAGEKYRAARYAHILGMPDNTFVFSKLRYWVGGNGRCYIGRDKWGRFVAIKEMRRTRYLYDDAVSKLKPRHMSGPSIFREYDWCRRLGAQLAPIAGAITATKAYLVLPLAHRDALSLASLLCEDPIDSSTAPRLDGFVVALLRDAGSHLAAIHAKGALHNDVKLNNIIFRKQDGEAGGEFQMLDFGMSYDLFRGRQKECNVYYGAPEAILHSDWPDSETCVDLKKFKQDSFALGLCCLWLIAGGGDSFEAVLPANEVTGSAQELADAYRAFEYSRRLARNDGSHKEGMYGAAWLDFKAAHGEAAARYTEIWAKAKAVLDPGLFEVVTQLLAFEPDERISASDAVNMLTLPDLAEQELAARRFCAGTESEALMKKHLQGLCSALADCYPVFAEANKV